MKIRGWSLRSQRTSHPLQERGTRKMDPVAYWSGRKVIERTTPKKPKEKRNIRSKRRKRQQRKVNQRERPRIVVVRGKVWPSIEFIATAI